MSSIRSIHPHLWPVKQRGDWRHIYVVQEGDGGPIKVGIAANAFWRLFDLQTGNWRKLNLRAVYVGDSKNEVFLLEQRIHAALGQHAIGGEWFDCRPEDAIELLEQEAN